MASILDKELLRDTTLEYDGKKLQIKLTPDQKITLKLKGIKSEELSISIDDLYKQLNGGEIKTKPVVKEEPIKIKDPKEPMIGLYALRSLSAVTAMSPENTVLFDSIISDLIKNRKKIQY